MKYFFTIIVIIGIICGTHVHAKESNLRYEVGQMLILGFEGKHIKDDPSILKAITYSNIGGVILFDYNSLTKTFDKNIESPEQVKQLNTDLQSINRFANNRFHRPSLPLLISVDYEGGKVNRLKDNYGFPPTLSAAVVAKLSFSDADQQASKMADTLSKAGFNLNFAPLVDLNINPENPIIGVKERSFSNDPNDVINFAEIYTHHYLSRGIQCAYKHFPGHGSSKDDSHLGFVDVTNSWQTDELEPYQQLINNSESCGMIMTAHIVNRQLDDSGLPATLSHKILTGILRDRLHFKGVIITDDMQMEAIRQYYGLEQAVTLAINAGVDMLMFGNQLTPNQKIDPEEVIDIIMEQINLGHISKDRIDEAYQHIVQLKSSLVNA